MLIAHGQQLTYGPVSGHRSGAIDFKRLLQGIPGAPDNFELSLVRTVGDYYTPRHLHNFDQVRLCLEGSMNFAPGKNLRPGMVGYFPEGTYYGPQKDTTGSIVLVLQIGGASGYGFMSYQQLNSGYEKMCDLGQFDAGVFTRTSSDGRVARADGYEAIWEYVNGRPIEYPPPRFEEPVIMNVDNFTWQPAGGGFEIKRLGAFGERGIEISLLRARRGAAHTSRGASPAELMFLLQGSIATSSGETLETHSAWRMDSSSEGERFEVTADAEIFVVRLPAFA